METDFCGPFLPPRFGQTAQSEHNSELSDHHSEHSEQPEMVCSSRAKEHSDIKKHKVWAKYFSQSSSSDEEQSSVSLLKSLLSPKGLLNKTNNKIIQTQSFTER